MVAKFKKQRKRGSKDEIIFQILFSFLILSLIAFLVISNLKINKERRELSKEIESLEEEILTLEEKKQRLEEGISQAGRESYWEEILREEGYVKEGESPIVILPPGEEEIRKEGQEETIFTPQALWDWIKSRVSR